MMTESTEKKDTTQAPKKPAVPLQIRCTVCGAPPEFNIIEQKYHCQNCGAFIGIEEPVVELNGWRELRGKEIRAGLTQSGCQIHACQNCGAQVVIPEGEATGACEFCGGKLVSRDFRDQEDFPEIIIPFYLTLEEARAQLKQWAADNKGKKEANTILSNLKNLRGYYLPYQLVKGPMSCCITRDQAFSDRPFDCKSYLQGLAVNTSKQFDNQVLNAAEPFDWSGLKPFEFGYVAGQKIKLSDLDTEGTQLRIRQEVEEDYRPVVEKTLETTGLTLLSSCGTLLSVSALLPVYVLQDLPPAVPADQPDREMEAPGDSQKQKRKKKGQKNRPQPRLWAVVNGQTGRVAVAPDRETPKKTYPWLIEPTILTLLAAAFFAWFFDGAWDGAAMGAAAFGLIFFTAFSEGRGAEFRSMIFRGAESRASRTGRRLTVESVHGGSNPGMVSANAGFGAGAAEAEGESRAQYGGTELYSKAAPPVFFEAVQGKEVPVTLKFYTPLRMVAILVFAVAFNALPQILAGFFLLTGLAAPPAEWHYGLGWMVLGLPITVILWVALGRIRIYNHPSVRQILADGSTKAVSTDRDQGNSISDNLKEMAQFAFEPGIRWATLGVLVILLGFTGAIIG